MSTPLRHDRDFRLFWLARATSLGGSSVTLVALPVLVYRLSGSPLLTALTSGLEGVPYLVFGLLAGVLADRMDRKRVMVALDLVSASVLTTVPVASALGVLTLGQVLVVAALVPSVFVFWDAAHFGALPALVGADRLPQANSAVWGVGSLLDIAAPAVTGALLAVFAPASLLTVDAASFAVSAVALRAVRGAFNGVRGESVPRGRAVLEGLQYLWHERTIRTLTAIGTLQCLTGGAFLGLLVVWADRDLGVHKGDPALGVLFAGFSLGGLVGTLLVPRLVRRWGVPTVTRRGLLVGATSAVALGFSPDWPVAAVVFAVWGAGYTVVVVNAITYRQQVCPDALMSRVNTTARMLSFGLGWPLGAVVGGALAQHGGPAFALKVTSGSLVVAFLLSNGLARQDPALEGVERVVEERVHVEGEPA